MTVEKVSAISLKQVGIIAPVFMKVLITILNAFYTTAFCILTEKDYNLQI